jgi:hypothetical protein
MLSFYISSNHNIYIYISVHTIKNIYFKQAHSSNQSIAIINYPLLVYPCFFKKIKNIIFD